MALGGSLHQRLQDVPGRMDHSTPMQPNSRVRTGKAHAVAVVPGSWLHRVAGATTIAINSLHNQGMDRLAAGPSGGGHGPGRDGGGGAGGDGAQASRWGCSGIQNMTGCTDAVSRGILASFGEAVRARITSCEQRSDRRRRGLIRVAAKGRRA